MWWFGLRNPWRWTDQWGADMVAAFRVDADGEVLVIDYAGGSLARIVARR